MLILLVILFIRIKKPSTLFLVFPNGQGLEIVIGVSFPPFLILRTIAFFYIVFKRDFFDFWKY